MILKLTHWATADVQNKMCNHSCTGEEDLWSNETSCSWIKTQAPTCSDVKATSLGTDDIPFSFTSGNILKRASSMAYMLEIAPPRGRTGKTSVSPHHSLIWQVSWECCRASKNACACSKQQNNNNNLCTAYRGTTRHSEITAHCPRCHNQSRPLSLNSPTGAADHVSGRNVCEKLKIGGRRGGRGLKLGKKRKWFYAN